MKRVLYAVALIILTLALLTGCGEKINYKHVSQEEAKAVLAKNPDAIILDVRTLDEYEKKHIPHAVNLPLEDLRNDKFEQIPDKNQTLLLYCWTGRRAQDAAQLLVDKGYKNVYEMGGIIDWTGPVEGTEVENN